MFVPNDEWVEICIMHEWKKAQVITHKEDWIELLMEGFPKFTWNTELLRNHIRNIKETIPPPPPPQEKKKRGRKPKQK